jgi:hypothetical protein
MRFIGVCIIMAVFCLVTIHFFPSTMGHAFNVGNFSVSWLLCLCFPYALLARKMTGK